MGIHVNLEMLTSPLLALATYAINNPSYSGVPKWFYRDAQQLFGAVRAAG